MFKIKYIAYFSLFLIYSLNLAVILEWDYVNEYGTAIVSFDCEKDRCIGKISNAKLHNYNYFNISCSNSMPGNICQNEEYIKTYQNEEFLQKLTNEIVFSIQSKFYNHIEGSTFDFWGTSKKHADFKNIWTPKEVIKLTKILDEKDFLFILPYFYETIIYDRINKENIIFKNKFKKLIIFLNRFILTKNLELPINLKNIKDLAYITERLSFLDNLAQRSMLIHLSQKGLLKINIPKEITSKIISYAFYKII